MRKIKKTILAILLSLIMPIIVLFSWHWEYYDDLPKWLKKWVDYVDN